MKASTKGRSALYSALVMALGLSLAASSVGAAEKPVAASSSATTDIRGAPSTAAVNQYELAAQVLDRWQPIATAVGQNAVTWRETFSTQFGLMDASVLNTIASVKVDASDAKASYALFSQAIRDAGMQSYMLAQSGKGHMKLGSNTSDFIFIPIVPCRLVDTRNVGGPISASTTRNYYFYTDGGSWDWSVYGGTAGAASTVCPGTVYTDDAPQFSAAVITVTVVSPSAGGNWIIWGGANPVPTVSALNWTGPGQILANTTVVPAGGRSGTGTGGGILDFAVRYNGPSGSAQFIADVVGYFIENKATALQCVYLSAAGTGTNNIANGGLFHVTAPTCTTGYTRTAIGCFFALDPGPLLNEVSPGLDVACYWKNLTGGTYSGTNLTAETVCCRVPGR